MGPAHHCLCLLSISSSCVQQWRSPGRAATIGSLVEETPSAPRSEPKDSPRLPEAREKSLRQHRSSGRLAGRSSRQQTAGLPRGWVAHSLARQLRQGKERDAPTDELGGERCAHARQRGPLLSACRRGGYSHAAALPARPVSGVLTSREVGWRPCARMGESHTRGFHGTRRNLSTYGCRGVTQQICWL